MNREIVISTSVGVFTVPLRLGIDAHRFARKYVSILSDAIDNAKSPSISHVIESLLNRINPESVPAMAEDILKGITYQGSSLNLHEVYLPFDIVIQLLLEVLRANCEPLLKNHYEPSRVVQGLKQKQSLNAQENRSIEKVSTTYLDDIKLSILTLANSSYNGGHNYQWFLEKCPLETFYDLQEYKNICEAITSEQTYLAEKKQKELSKRK